MKIKVKYFTDIEELKKVAVGDWVDLRAAKDVCLFEGQYMAIPLGVAMELPEGYEAIVAPRSSTFKNFGLLMTNSIGVIDNSYCGDDDQWHFPAYATKDIFIQKGDRICQFRIIKNQPELEFETVDKLGNQSRGGFGSTGTE